MEDAELEASIAAIQHPRHKAWLSAYLADPARDASEAARVAGYGTSGTSLWTRASRLKKRYSQIIAAYDVRSANASLVGPREAQELLAEIARDRNVTERDRLKAIELIARIHGMLTDQIKFDGNLNVKQAILAAIGSVIVTPSALPVVDAVKTLSAGDQTTEDAEAEVLGPLPVTY